MSDQDFSKRVGAFASATFISRILGYVRDALVASYFGGGIYTDAFYAAFKIPNLMRRFLGEGALTAAFVPVFTETLHKEGEVEAKKLFNALLSGLVVLLSVIVMLGIVFAPFITKVVSYGFTSDPEKFALTVELTRLTFPFLLVICLAALATAVLNSRGHFFVPAVAPSGLSIGEIVFILFVAKYFDSAIHGLAVSAVVGVGIHLVWQLPAMIKEGYSFHFVRPFADPRVKTVFMLMIPTVIGLCADQVNSFVDQFCASFLREGSITALYNSNRVMQLPLALFGVAVSSVSLPALSKAAANDSNEEFKKMLGFSVRIANYVLIPSFIGLAVLGLPIIKLLFEHGKFTPDYSLLTYGALLSYAAGLPAYSMCKILATAFYARKNTKAPMHIAFYAMFVNVIGDLLSLFFHGGVGGLAFATTASAWVQSIILFVVLRRQIGCLGGREIWKSFATGVVGGLLMGVVCWFSYATLLAHFHLLFRVLFSISLGSLFYFGLSKFFKIPEYEFFIATLRRKKTLA